ncbi:MAG: hypothetical protein WD431_12000 [Cyclobacteriaceae bacterium]
MKKLFLPLKVLLALLFACSERTDGNEKSPNIIFIFRMKAQLKEVQIYYGDTVI